MFVDASETLAAVARRLLQPDDPPFAINLQPDIAPEDLPALLAGAQLELSAQDADTLTAVSHDMEN